MRQYQDLREFLTALEQETLLFRITEEVKFEPDLAAAACALVKVGEGAFPRQFFSTTSRAAPDVQITENVHGSWPNHALALGMDKSAPLRDQFFFFFFEFVRRFKLYPGEKTRRDPRRGRR